MRKWKPVVGYEYEYRVSSGGEVFGIKRQRLLAPVKNTQGYFWVGLWKNGKYKAWFIHVLVLEAFVGPRPSGGQARHTPDKNPANNHVKNLKWGSAKDNAKDRDQQGSTVRGERFWSAKATDAQICRIRQLGRIDTRHGRGRRIATEVNLSVGIVRAILNGKTWKHAED